ncbi:MAG: hypothetical protein Q9160_006297 [Pyrenula sp. 1 TL-2023]
MFLKVVLALSLVSTRAWGAAVPPTSAGTWSTLPNVTMNGTQYPRQEHSVALIGDDMYVLGGILPFNGAAYPTIGVVQKFNFITNAWTDLSPMPAALNHVNVAVVNGLIYYLGGLADAGPTYWNRSGACAMYDPAADQWTVLPDMPEGRSIGSAATLVHDETIYLAGGLLNTNLTNDDEGTTTMFTSYNTKTQEWAILPDLPAPRDHAGKGQWGNTLYILGGRLFGHWNVVDTVFGYDVYSQQWSADYAPMPTARGGVASAAIGSQIFTAGGEGNPNATVNGVWPQMQAYDPVKDAWTTYADMATPVHGSGAVAYAGQIVVPAGGLMTGADPTQLVQRFTP